MEQACSESCPRAGCPWLPVAGATHAGAQLFSLQLCSWSHMAASRCPHSLTVGLQGADGHKALRPRVKQCGEEFLLCLSVPRLRAALRADWEARARSVQGRRSSPAPWLPALWLVLLSLGRLLSSQGLGSLQGPCGLTLRRKLQSEGQNITKPDSGSSVGAGFSVLNQPQVQLLGEGQSPALRGLQRRVEENRPPLQPQYRVIIQSPETSEEEARSQGFASHPHAAPHPQQRSSGRPVPVCPLRVDPLLSGCIEHTGLLANEAQRGLTEQV